MFFILVYETAKWYKSWHDKTNKQKKKKKQQKKQQQNNNNNNKKQYHQLFWM